MKNKKDYFPPTQVTNREIDLKERIKIIITEYKNCESVEVEIEEDLMLANNECDSNFYEADSTEKVKEFNEKVIIKYIKKALEFWNLNEKKSLSN